MRSTVALLAVALAACNTHHALSPDGGTGGAGDASSGVGGAGASGSAGTSGGAGGNPEAGAMGTSGVGGASGPIVLDFAASASRNVDVIFMVDDSLGMSPSQSMLISAFSSYTNTLKALPGGLPNLHIGVVSSSMGAGRNASIDHCPQGGDQGMFHTKPLGPSCSKASLNPGQNFIMNVNGQANYTGDLSDVFGCIAALGDGGCGFEHQLESVQRALGADGAPAPPSNVGFLRNEALLQIVLLTNEDDCSAQPSSDLFDNPDPTNPIASPYGPLQSYRCNEFGHLCNGQRPPRMPMGIVDLGTCVSAEDGILLRVRDVFAALRTLKTDPFKVFLSTIAGPPTPYKVNVGPSQVKGDPSEWPYVEHSCLTPVTTSGAQVYADPAVRLKELTGAFGENGFFTSICEADLGPILKAVAQQIGRAFSPCLPADSSSCTFVDHGASDTPLRRCTDASDVGPCWIPTSSAQCPAGQGVLFNRPGAPDPTLSTTATCPM
jgi:hypothetical protein